MNIFIRSILGPTALVALPLLLVTSMSLADTESLPPGWVKTEVGDFREQSIESLCITPNLFIGKVVDFEETHTDFKPFNRQVTDITFTVERDLTDTFGPQYTVTIPGVWIKGHPTSSAGHLLPAPVVGRRYLIGLDLASPKNAMGYTKFWTVLRVNNDLELPSVAQLQQAWISSSYYEEYCGE